MSQFWDELEELIRSHFGSSQEPQGRHEQNPPELLPIHRKLHELEKRMSSVESGQDALNQWAAELTQDVQNVADELAQVMQQNQSGQLTSDQVNAALSPIHAKLAGLVTANPVDPGTTTDPTNSPAPDSPVVNPAPDAPTDEPTPDPTVNPVNVDPSNLPPSDGSSPADPNAIPNGGGFQEDL